MSQNTLAIFTFAFYSFGSTLLLGCKRTLKVCITSQDIIFNQRNQPLNRNKTEHHAQTRLESSAQIEKEELNILRELTKNFNTRKKREDTDTSSKIKHDSQTRPLFKVPMDPTLLYTTANQVTQTTTSKPRSSAPVYLKVHMPSRFTSQKAPEAECIPRLPALLSDPSAAADSSITPCCTMVLFTVKR
jgi:hypothetical protein